MRSNSEELIRIKHRYSAKVRTISHVVVVFVGSGRCCPALCQTVFSALSTTTSTDDGKMGDAG